MKRNFLTTAELIEKLKLLPPDSIPIIEKWNDGDNFTFKAANFQEDEYESPYFGNDDVDSDDIGFWNADGEFEYNVKFFIIAGI